jgi:hypothetical protein
VVKTGGVSALSAEAHTKSGRPSAEAAHDMRDVGNMLSFLQNAAFEVPASTLEAVKNACVEVFSAEAPYLEVDLRFFALGFAPSTESHIHDFISAAARLSERYPLRIPVESYGSMGDWYLGAVRCLYLKCLPSLKDARALGVPLDLDKIENAINGALQEKGEEVRAPSPEELVETAVQVLRAGIPVAAPALKRAACTVLAQGLNITPDAAQVLFEQQIIPAREALESMLAGGRLNDAVIKCMLEEEPTLAEELLQRAGNLTPLQLGVLLENDTEIKGVPHFTDLCAAVFQRELAEY